VNFRISGLILLCGAALGMGSGPALAASEFIQGLFSETDPAGPSYRDLGVCTFTTGPRDDVPAGHFLLTVGDQHETDATELQLTGTYSTKVHAFGGPFDAEARETFALHPDKAAAAQFFQDVLREQLADELAFFQLKDLDAEVNLAPPGGRLLCTVKLTGRLTLSHARERQVNLSFSGAGLYYPGDMAPPVKGKAPAVTMAPDAAAPSAVAQDADPSCPTASLAPLGLAPVPGQCTPGTQCVVNFKNYQWWTSFQYYGPPGNSAFPYGGYFYNGGLRTAFAPKHAFVDGAGLHLRIDSTDLGGGPVTAGGEAVLMFNADSSEANLGYGDYLVTATVTNSDWATLDPNAAFGVFTYERVGAGSTGPSTNPARELDLAEISRWGWNQNPPPACPNTGLSKPLCEGNAQFAIQPWDKRDEQNDPPNWTNLHRYTITPGVKIITLVMRWHGANQPVTFEEYNSALTLQDLNNASPPKPDNIFTSDAAAQNVFIPATACERFHLNLWMGFFNNAAARGCSNERGDCPPNPPPSTLPQEVVVTNFEFQKP
jgi:hypothetical protein